jgi:hypothetical protein
VKVEVIAYLIGTGAAVTFEGLLPVVQLGGVFVFLLWLSLLMVMLVSYKDKQDKSIEVNTTSQCIIRAEEISLLPVHDLGPCDRS